jgi:hypothetical protein
VSNLSLNKIELEFQQGIPDFTRTHVSAFHLRIDKLNLQLPLRLRITDGSLAAKYAAMTVHFDANLAQQLELAEVTAAVKAPATQGTLASARGVFDAVLTKLERWRRTHDVRTLLSLALASPRPARARVGPGQARPTRSQTVGRRGTQAKS